DSAVVSEDIRTDSTGMLVLVTEKAQVIRTNLGEIRSTGRIAQGVKIQVPESGDRISAIRVISEMREAAAEIDPALLENGNGESDSEDSSIESAVGVDGEPAESEEE
ncbi:MAG: hypothetical protein O6922_05065, partial [Chloroflexi bacterium]|nr:hypothetical protein [Chloroflexota bacterium]